ncbi:hypothetical protein SAMN04515691_3971 [Leifsonia sp. 98AMF]|uniref:hypothetical protein n=1 Tax=unclassified Leifsonia TaxID=2663824 RepID=UPI00087AFE13|nr:MULTISPECIES: hypothetical protein [unclassified Leifsonia]SDG96354.1 hypothetical protein SAMN04515690_0046 [Leifsonia sp. 197AMF]SDJ45119.1 hypothetical protein SAMN04515684_3737 [Leifsonia sp. 466MF]SDK30742.1 hypothetical protein SAMN04515683_3028 [Leifsonia sp. 157MF]SDN65470.1 hypothetical protein SAMN04515686_1924 [Leifsonia sp. 509MF]SEN43221.1 hypothetical protein SAMN04515685_3011 [Leifsonia sp. 467MF]
MSDEARPHDWPHHVLELRIHGIKNTPPTEMLGREQSELRQTQGDENGGFWWAPKQDEPDRDPDDAPGTIDPAVPPPDVRTEAYSWGRLARYGSGPLLFIGQLFVQLAWLLLAPFGLANSAYWTRRIPTQRAGGEWDAGVGGASLRIFALGLTLLYVCALGSVSLDLGVQCVTGTACTALPEAVTGFFANAPLSWRGPQLSLLSLVPIAGVLLLFLVSRRARARYEAAIFDAADRMGGRGVRRNGRLRPLASEGFWRTARVGSPTERLHLAAAFLLVALLLAWDRMFAGAAACVKLQTFVSGECLSAAFGSRDVLALSGGIIAAAGLTVTIILVGVFAETTSTGDAGDTSVDEFLRDRLRRTGTVTAWVLVVSILVYLYVGATLWFGGEYAAPPSGAFLGLATAPSIILGVLLAICISALGWRRGVPHWRSIALMTGAGLTFLAGVAQNPPTQNAAPGPLRLPLFAIAAVLTLAQLILVWRWPYFPSGRRAGPPERFRAEGWAGMGPGVVMLWSLGAAMILSTLLVLGVQGWLVSGSPPCGCATPPHAVLRPPIVYHNFGDVLPFIAIALALVGIGVAAAVLRWVPLLTTPRTRDGRRPLLEQVDAYRDGRIAASTTADRLALKILRARRLAALVHRGEPILGILAALLAVGFVVALAVSYSVVFRWIDALVGPALAVIAAAILAVVVENALTAKERPISIMWDLMCFLPRAGHPFGPPCYAERVVPELRDRVADWLTHDREPPEGLTLAERLRWRDEQEEAALGEKRPFSVVLSAHSLGAVLAVSTLFTLRPDDADRLRNVALLTYGSQLRVYFGRFFPELFGPDALGTLGSRRPLLGKADPWFTQVERDQDGDPVVIGASGASDPSLVQLLTQEDGSVAWINLWRRTDYLGFPVNSYRLEDRRPDDIDRGADEFGPPRYLVKVATHPDYQSAPQYRVALLDLIARLDAPAPPAPPASPGSPSNSS